MAANADNLVSVGPIRVVIAERSDVLRAALREYLIRHGGDIALAGMAADAEDMLRQVLATRPDVVVVDLHVTDTAGCEIAERIREAAPEARIVFVSEPGTSLTQKLRKYGACLALRREELANHLLEAIRRCARGACGVSEA